MSDYMIQKADDQIENGVNEKDQLLKQQLAEKDAIIEKLIKGVEFYACTGNWKCSGFTNDYLTEFKLKITDEDAEIFSEAFTRGGKLARQTLKEIKDR